MNENPALEWNKLGNGSSLDPYFSTSSVLTKYVISTHINCACDIFAILFSFNPQFQI